MLRKLAVLVGLAVVAASCGGDDGNGNGDDGSADAAPADPLLIETDLGPVQGTSSDVEGVRAFLTIPYAAPPTGENRWRPPQPAEPWDDALDATELGAACPQPDAGTSLILETPDWDPDCLTLNVWAPEEAADLPVMVWIHGGGFLTGSAHEPYYIGDNVASEGVILVSMNYRLGALGFLATEELAEENEDGSFGNYGLADQTAVLEWVQRNIAGFGGDPDNVTIFGESAGGFSVCGHMASPASEGLFHKAIVQSGGGCNRLQPGDDAIAAGDALLDDFDCEDIACLREVPEEELIAASFDGSLVADDVRLSSSAFEQAADGALDDLPVIIGSNHDEETLFTLQEGLSELTDQDLLDRLSAVSDDPEEVLALYPAEDYETNLARYQTMFTDIRWACPTLAFAEQVPGAFVYHHTYVSDQNVLDLGATHGSELAPLFGHPEGIEAFDIEVDERGTGLGEQMRAAWAAFATDGNPGDDWSLYAEDQQVTQTDTPFELVDEIREGRCADLEPLTEVDR